MRNTLAGTKYTACVVHTLIEIGNGAARTAAQLTSILNVEIEVVEASVRYLIDAGEITKSNTASSSDNRSFVLTPKGQQSPAQINQYARDQVLTALDNIPGRDLEAILHGLHVYSASLNTRSTERAKMPQQQIEIARGYRPGLIARTLQMRMDFYSRTVGFGARFEHELATALADIVSRLQDKSNDVWTAVSDDKIFGTVYIDGQHVGSNKAHLRAFIVDPEVRGGGVGRRLLTEAIKFADEQNFDETHLWTFQGLDAARKLYESFGFVLSKQAEGTQWGEIVVEQLFIRKSGVGSITTSR